MRNSGDMPPSLTALLSQLDSQGIYDHRRYEMVRRFLNFRAREKNIPISGCFELTPLCNLDCRMCYVHLNKAQMHDAPLLSTAVWKDLMKQAVDGGMMYARLTGGECLIYPGFRELYLYLREEGVETVILSNGILMDGDMTAFLAENPPAAIQITLYGASEDAYERVTGSRAFSTVLENIKRLQRAKLPLIITTTPNAYMNDGEEIVRLVHALGLSLQINSGLMAPREETGRVKLDAGLDTYVQMVKLNHKLRGGEDFAECDENSLPDPGGDARKQCGVTCGAGRSTFSISWRGEMRPCNTFPCDPADVVALGFRESWKRISALANSFPLPAECAGCRYQKQCKHCVSEHASDAPIGHASPAICAWAKRMAAEGIIKL